MKWTATKVTTTATATKAISSVATRAGSDTGYHLVSQLPPMHTVAAATALPRPRGRAVPGGARGHDAGVRTDRGCGTKRRATGRGMNDKIVMRHWRTEHGWARASAPLEPARGPRDVR